MRALRNHTDLWRQFPCQNLSLLIDRLSKSVDEPGSHQHKDESLRERNNFKNPINENNDAYNCAFKNCLRAWETHPDAESIYVKTTSPLFLGTGNANLHEAGVQLLRPWGVPYLPAAGIKGALSTWLAKNGGNNWKRGQTKKSDYQTEIFGGVPETQKQAFAGSVLFADAWLDASASGKSAWFAPDIITPHHQSYYQGTTFPDGISNPVPISVSTLRKGLVFVVTLVGPQDRRSFLFDVLKDLLENGGIGAKTSVGYGRCRVYKSTTSIRETLGRVCKIDELETLLDDVWKGNLETLSSDFQSALKRLPVETMPLDKEQYSEVFALLKDLLPQRLFRAKLERQKPSSLKEAKNLRGDLNIKDGDISGSDPDYRAIFNLCFGLVSNGELKGTWLENYAYSWDEWNPSLDELYEIVDNKNSHRWPLLGDLAEHLRKRNDLAEDDRDLLLEEIDT